MNQHDSSFETSNPSPQEGEGVLLISMASRRNLNVRSGAGAMLGSMGLAPSLHQDSMDAKVSVTPEEPDPEVGGNASVHASKWEEMPIVAEGEINEDIGDDLLRSENQVGAEAWPYCTSPDAISPLSQNTSSEGVLFSSSSSSSFFGEILASSSLPVVGSVDADNFSALGPGEASLAFSFTSHNRGIAGDAEDSTNRKLEAFQLSVKQVDANPGASLDAAGRGDPRASLSLQMVLPSLPSENDVAELLAHPSPTTSALETSQPQSVDADSLLLVLDDEQPASTSHILPSDVSYIDIASTLSLVIPNLSSVESLMRMSLDIPDLSFGSSSSIYSLCEVPTLSSMDDLARVEPPPGLSMDAEGDDEAFQALPPHTISPFRSCTPKDLPSKSKNYGSRNNGFGKTRLSFTTLHWNS